MKNRIIGCLAAFAMIICLLPLAQTAAAEESAANQEAQELLQKGLTIYEIDLELERLNEQDEQIAGQIISTEKEIELQDGKVQETRKHAGKVLRAYYTGERDSIWLLLFSLRSFSDVWKTFEYLSMIIQNDQRALTAFTASFEQLKDLKSELESSRQKLQATKENYLKQRERLVALQAELDQQLAVSAQAKMLKEQIKSLNDQWENEGKPLFRQYFQGLSKAFHDLPELLSKDGGKNVSINGLNAALQLTDKELNDFLGSKDPLLQSLVFTFMDGKVTASGKKDPLQIDIAGNFKLFEHFDANEVRFKVDRLTFNKYQLPDTTITVLEQEFKLGFYPKKAASFLEVNSVRTEAGKLVVKLKLSF